MIPRILEPEVMDTAEEAADYDAMDHSVVNRLFVDDFLNAMNTSPLAGRFRDATHPLQILDVGTGTAQIPIELCRRDLVCRIAAIDLSDEMLKLGRKNVVAASLESSICLERIDAKRLPYPDRSFDAVISNSIVHHIPNPAPVFAEMRRVTQPNGILFVRDLLRPDDARTIESLVVTHCGNASKHQQQMFRDSLRASLNLDEIRVMLQEIECAPPQLRQTSDRHWTLIIGLC